MADLQQISRQQNRAWLLISVGIVGVGVGFALFVLLGAASIGASMSGPEGPSTKAFYVGVLVGLLGLAAFIAGLVEGIRNGFSRPGRMPERRVDNVFIVGKTAISKDGYPIMDYDMIDATQDQLLVRIALSDGTRMEMKTSFPVFMNTPEGMVGNIVHQGTWLSQFTPNPQAERPYVPPQVY